MSDNSKSASNPDLSTRIADALRADILAGQFTDDDRLPSEAELCDKHGVSRSTVREALKRLAAQNLIRTRRGATGGAFVNRISFEQAYGEIAGRATMLLSLNDVDFTTACQARFALERGCAQLSAQNHTPAQLDEMRAQIMRQQQANLSDEDFCASDVAFHRAFVDAAQNPVLSWTLAAAVEGMQPLMNMITYRQRDREAIVELHTALLNAVENRDGRRAEATINALCAQTIAHAKAAQRAKRDHHTLVNRAQST
ncbi:FadR/GntR family transcriptional regulator [Celeribacter sp.]|uniref:FadR/GntR family transcriptional regulator n=1 Tax=Celeribacter sp. TaxID=1890673 RepID=UPI003A922FD9